MPEQTNLNVSLTPRFMSLLRDRVSSGRYRSASEVIRDGLRLLEERDRREQAFWADARRKVAVGKKQLRAGTPKMGLFLNAHSPTVAEQLAHSGYDWLLVDTQHGPMNYEKLSAMLSGIANGGAASNVVIPVLYR